ncbi:hypothetical protein B7494_g3731 [Chlorociboria aeruginascens]|nr:hypothetical protein B7494_g3731 [Chlorociboria aeruginascens]
MRYSLAPLAIIGAVTFLADDTFAAPAAEPTKVPEESLAHLADFAVLPGPVIVQSFPALSSATVTPDLLPLYAFHSPAITETSQTAFTVSSTISSAIPTSNVDAPFTLDDFANEIYEFMDMTLHSGWIWAKTPNTTALYYTWVPNPSNETAPIPTGRQLRSRHHPFRLPFFHREGNHTTSLNMTSLSNMTSRPWWKPHFVVFPHSKNATASPSKELKVLGDLEDLPQAHDSAIQGREDENYGLGEHQSNPIELHQTPRGLFFAFSGSLDELTKYRDDLTGKIHVTNNETKAERLETEREVIDQLLMKAKQHAPEKSWDSDFELSTEIEWPTPQKIIHSTSMVTHHPHTRFPAATFTPTPTPAPRSRHHMKRELAASEVLEGFSEDELMIYLQHLTLNFVSTQYMHQLGVFMPADHIYFNGTFSYNSTATAQNETGKVMHLPKEMVFQLNMLVQAKNATSLPVSNEHPKRQLFNSAESHTHSFPLQLHSTPSGLTITSTGSRGDLENYIKVLDCYIGRNDKKGILNHPPDGTWWKYTSAKWRSQADVYKADQEFERAIAMEMLKHVPPPIVTVLTGLNGGLVTLSELPTAEYTVPLDHLLYSVTWDDATDVASATAPPTSVFTSYINPAADNLTSPGASSTRN